MLREGPTRNAKINYVREAKDLQLVSFIVNRSKPSIKKGF